MDSRQNNVKFDGRYKNSFWSKAAAGDGRIIFAFYTFSLGRFRSSESSCTLKYNPLIQARTLVFSTTIFLSTIGQTFLFIFFNLIVRAPIVIASLRSHVTTSRHFSGINYYPRQPCTFSYLFTSNLNPTMQLTGLCHRTWIKSRRCRAEWTWRWLTLAFLARQT